MFYVVTVRDHIRVPPSEFGKSVEEAVLSQVREKYTGYISKELGFVVDVDSVVEVSDGVIIPGDGARYHDSVFSLIVFVPEMHEVLVGVVRDVAEFGVFLDVGPLDGMVHISQAMNDFVSFTKDRVLQGRDSGRSLKVGDECLARVVAVSFKDLSSPKVGLTMRQQGLGKDEWILEDFGEVVKKKGG